MSNPYESYQSGEYLANNPTWDMEDSGWKAQQVLKVLQESHLTPTSIVEVGCGAGGILAALHGALPAVHYTGYEIAPDASRFWEKPTALGIDLFVSDFLQTETEHFDVLMLLDVIEHVPDPIAFLSQIRGRANYYVLHIPLDLSALSVSRETPLLAVRQKVGHIHYFTKGLALSLLSECGFEVIDWKYTGAALNSPQATIKTRLARIPRLLLSLFSKDWAVRLLGGETLLVLARQK